MSPDARDASFRITRTILLTEFADGTWDGTCTIHDRSLPLAERMGEGVTGADPMIVVATLTAEERP